ncbi:hypothetical protein M409DRAFT_66308 [Zasmidium cellare ATCC 36951]|uniref:NAD(P)-binding protein n=1 Tax=Zasmidium cellare ATCC 36951 TaxID=1080233 RepID=A0A6A6CL14_ZASCE|nr:uncharacterized protein M409DRAFT_66308 [Zasmidium cellare ATCC 36951]KAF2167313.1 hypothetical protein M409DRAFT_66308 [Zasmidium cellare ATCC 36951]
MAYTWDLFRQCFFVPKPTLTETNLPDQTGRIAIVTGGYSGAGKELCGILYKHNATIYIAGRSTAKYDEAVASIKKACPRSKGRLEFLKLDLSDLTTIKPAAEAFMKQEQQLHVLTNNAGAIQAPVGSHTDQGIELHMGTNVVGHFLLTRHLEPVLRRTAQKAPSGSVRVTWASSIIASMKAPEGGIDFDADGNPKVLGDPVSDYAQSKAANYVLAREFSKRLHADGIVSVPFNPGQLATQLSPDDSWTLKLATRIFAYEAVYGAYVELFAGWADEVGEAGNGEQFVVPWGRFGVLSESLKNSKKGGDLWAWCEKQCQSHK